MTTPPELSGRSWRHLGDLCYSHALLVDPACDHVRAELAGIGYKVSHRLEGMPHGNAELTSTEAGAQARWELGAGREQMRDNLIAMYEIEASDRQTIIAVAGIRLPTVDTSALRCSGKVDPTCTQMASDHRDADGSVVEGLCDQCHLAACNECHSRPRAAYRSVCEACRKRDERKMSHSVPYA